MPQLIAQRVLAGALDDFASFLSEQLPCDTRPLLTGWGDATGLDLDDPDPAWKRDVVHLEDLEQMLADSRKEIAALRQQIAHERYLFRMKERQVTDLEAKLRRVKDEVRQVRDTTSRPRKTRGKLKAA